MGSAERWSRHRAGERGGRRKYGVPDEKMCVETRKVSYVSEHSALIALERLRHSRSWAFIERDAYQCQHGEHWHLGTNGKTRAEGVMRRLRVE